jgi:hypothetical protein
MLSHGEQVSNNEKNKGIAIKQSQKVRPLKRVLTAKESNILRHIAGYFCTTLL